MPYYYETRLCRYINSAAAKGKTTHTHKDITLTHRIRQIVITYTLQEKRKEKG